MKDSRPSSQAAAGLGRDVPLARCPRDGSHSKGPHSSGLGTLVPISTSRSCHWSHRPSPRSGTQRLSGLAGSWVLPATGGQVRRARAWDLPLKGQQLLVDRHGCRKGLGGRWRRHGGWYK